MRKSELFLLTFFFFLLQGLLAQNVTFQDDNINRGYYSRAYLRYEAEPGRCETTGTTLNSTYDQRTLQSEASNQIATSLTTTGSYVQWVNTTMADGLTIRFSLPDNATGSGTTGTFALYVNNMFVENITVNSYWSWQYILKSGSKYPDNTPNSSTKFPRMRFDETHVKLATKIPANAVFKLVKVDENNVPYTIDFVELEEVPAPVAFESITDQNKVIYTTSQGDIAYFISQNKGKTIYIPEGRYETQKRIIITLGDNTKIIGAGAWYTQIYFAASSDERGTYSQRGIEAYGNNIFLQGLYLNTVNNKRYFQNNDTYQVGKGLMGSFGVGSVVRDMWIEHFECGGWLEKAERLLIQNCRFRNNYADGINFSYGTKNSVVEHCSFRNNGDDDIATWSRADGLCENNIFRYCTSENNWRASSLGFFGGKQNKAHNCVIIDPMEAGFRATCDFPGMPFSSDGYNEFYDISVYKGGVASGAIGVSGDLWGNQQGAIHLFSSSQYDLQNIKIHDIDLYDSKNDAIFIGSSSKSIKSLVLKNINIHGAGRYGTYFSSTKGNGTYCNISYENIGASTNYNPIPSAFSYIEDCDVSALEPVTGNTFIAFFLNEKLHITGLSGTFVSIYDVLGRQICQKEITSNEAVVEHPTSGLYLVKWNTIDQVQKILIP